MIFCECMNVMNVRDSSLPGLLVWEIYSHLVLSLGGLTTVVLTAHFEIIPIST